MHDEMKEYVKSGEYFADAKKWYEFKYLHPLPERSISVIIFAFIALLFLQISFSLYSLLPLKAKIQYFIPRPDLYKTTATITQANSIDGDDKTSIADIMIKDYVFRRENFDYDNLQNQFNYIKNTSTKIVFRKFYNYMNIDNPDSPIMLYQNFARRNVNVISAEYLDDGKAIVAFESLVRNISGEILENKVWQAIISYEIDEINLKLPKDAKFNFLITNYQTQLLKDKKKHK